MSEKQDRGLENFDMAIVEDRGPGEEVLTTVKHEANADHELRITESQAEALLDYDRIIAPTKNGERIVVEVTPDEPKFAPVEIRGDGE